MRASPLHLAHAFFAVTSISLVPICVTMVTADVIVIGTIRLIIAVTGVLLFLLYNKTLLSLSFAQWRAISLIGLLFGAHWITFFLSIKLSTPSIAAIGISTYGIHIILFNWRLVGKRPNSRNLLVIAMAILGSLIAIPELSIKNSHTQGLLIGIASGFFYALVPIVHQQNRHISNGMRTLAQFSVALVLFLLLTPWGNWDFSSSDWPLLIFMGIVCTLIGHALWVSASTHLPIQIISAIFYLGLPFTLLFEVLLLGKGIVLTTMIGAALILIANFINIDWRKQNE